MAYNNYHMHTTFCDGGNTAEEMVQACIAAGCEEVGFSGHSYLPFDDEWTMVPEQAAAYRAEVKRLAEVYKDQISIRLGIEQDLCSPTDELGEYEYNIGAVHCLFKDGNYVSIDLDVETLQKCIQDYYGGDPYALVEHYYEEVSKVYEKTHCQIIAHFDLVTKFLERGIGIDLNHQRYVAAADRALEVLMKTPAAFEINTGAISRGYRHEPYPDERILAKLGEAGAKVILSSDSHSVDTVVYDFDNAMKLVEKYGLNLVTSIDELL